jgi:hypothetical protein
MREAAENLARIERFPSCGAYRYPLPADDPLVRTLRPELGSFKDPTAAEALLAAMDRHMKAVASTGNWAEIEEEKYLIWIAELGDARIAPELRARSEKTTDARTRHRLAFTLRRLGDSGPIDALAREIDKGAQPIDARDGREIVEAFGRAGSPACEAVLAGFARPDHAWHARAKESILEFGHDHEAWVSHPYCLSLLRRLLGNESSTGSVVVVEGEWAVRKGGGGGFGYSGGPPLPKGRREKAVERECDQAAYRMSGLMPDAPAYHPLLPNADERLRELRAYVDANLGKFQRMTREEAAARQLPEWGRYWVVAK